MMVYVHSVDCIILIFPCIENLFIELIKFNVITFFHVLTLILSKCQRQIKLMLTVGGYRFIFSFKKCSYFHYFGLFYYDNGPCIKYVRR